MNLWLVLIATMVTAGAGVAMFLALGLPARRRLARQRASNLRAANVQPLRSAANRRRR